MTPLVDPQSSTVTPCGPTPTNDVAAAQGLVVHDETGRRRPAHRDTGRGQRAAAAGIRAADHDEVEHGRGSAPRPRGWAASAAWPTATDAPCRSGGIPTTASGASTCPRQLSRGTGSPRCSARAAQSSAAVDRHRPLDDDVDRAGPASGHVHGEGHLHGGHRRKPDRRRGRVIHRCQLSGCDNGATSGSLCREVAGRRRGPAAGGGAVDAVRTLEGEVRELIRRSGLDPARDEGEVRRLVREAVADYDERSMHRWDAGAHRRRRRVRARCGTRSPGSARCSSTSTTRRSRRSGSTSPSRVFVARDGVAELTTTMLTARPGAGTSSSGCSSRRGRRVDLSSPFVDALLPDGSRLHVVIPDITREHWSVNIRKFVVQGRLDGRPGAARHPHPAGGALPRGRRARPGSTSWSPAAPRPARRPCSTASPSAIPARERVVTCEEVFELRIPHRDVVVDAVPPAVASRAPARSRCADLVKEALRMRPVADHRRRGAPGRGVPRPAASR